jgi:hypothetical protein
MEALWGRGGTAPTHSQPRHYMGVSGQRHAPAALYPWGKDPRYPLYTRLGGPQSRSSFNLLRSNQVKSPLLLGRCSRQLRLVLFVKYLGMHILARKYKIKQQYADW